MLFIIIFGTLSFPVVSVHGMTRGVVAGFFAKFRTVCNNTPGWNNQIFTCPSFAHLCTSLIRPIPPPDRGAEYCDDRVCLFVCPRAYMYFWNCTFDCHQRSCACCLWPGYADQESTKQAVFFWRNRFQCLLKAFADNASTVLYLETNCCSGW